MNALGATIVLRERTSLDVLDLAILFCRQRGQGQYLTLALLSLVPSWLLLVSLRHFTQLGWGYLWLAALALHTLLELPFLVHAGRLLFEQDAPLKATWRSTASRLPAFVGTQLLILLLLVASLLTVVGPGIVAVVYCFVPEVLVLEGASGLAALRRSQQFLARRSGAGLAAAGLRLTLLAAFVGIGEVLGQAGLSVLFDVHIDTEQLLEDGGSPFALAGLLLSVPLTATFRFLSYVSERTVQDGWDVQVALLALSSQERNESVS